MVSKAGTKEFYIFHFWPGSAVICENIKVVKRSFNAIINIIVDVINVNGIALNEVSHFIKNSIVNNGIAV